MSFIQKSIGKLLSDVVKANSDRDALVHTEIGNRYSYENLSHETDRAARGFLSRGIKPGDRIALWSPNVTQWLFAMLGLAKIGAVTVPVDPADTKDYLYYIWSNRTAADSLLPTVMILGIWRKPQLAPGKISHFWNIFLSSPIHPVRT